MWGSVAFKAYLYTGQKLSISQFSLNWENGPIKKVKKVKLKQRKDFLSKLF